MIINKFRKILFDRKWKKINKNNFTTATNIFDPSLVEIGNYTYGGIKVVSFSNDRKLKIGSFCSIAENVSFLLNCEHNLKTLSTYPFKVRVLGKSSEATSKGDIILEDDVWVGYGAIILSGVTIGKGSVIAAGSVVTKNIAPYSIVGGNPAMIIRKRFDNNIIKMLLDIDYGSFTADFINENIDLFYDNLNENNVHLFLTKLK